MKQIKIKSIIDFDEANSNCIQYKSIAVEKITLARQ